MLFLDIYLANLLSELCIYMIVSIHTYICTDMSVDAELAKGGGWIYAEGEGTGEQTITSMTSHE